MICGSGRSKTRLAKAAGAEPAGQMRDEKLHAVVARSTFPSQNVQNTPFSDHFWKLRCRKVHTVVARSTFRSQNVQNTPLSDHFWKLRCRKSARRCGAKHISKSKCTKHTIVGPLLEVEMSKKCTPLWREGHFEVKMLKTPGVRTTFGSSDVEKMHAVVARSIFRSQNVKTPGVRTTFGGSDVPSRGRRKGLCTLSKVSNSGKIRKLEIIVEPHFTIFTGNRINCLRNSTKPVSRCWGSKQRCRPCKADCTNLRGSVMLSLLTERPNERTSEELFANVYMHVYLHRYFKWYVYVNVHVFLRIIEASTRRIAAIFGMDTSRKDIFNCRTPHIYGWEWDEPCRLKRTRDQHKRSSLQIPMYNILVLNCTYVF